MIHEPQQKHTSFPPNTFNNYLGGFFFQVLKDNFQNGYFPLG